MKLYIAKEAPYGCILEVKTKVAFKTKKELISYMEKKYNMKFTNKRYEGIYYNSEAYYLFDILEVDLLEEEWSESTNIKR